MCLSKPKVNIPPAPPPQAPIGEGPKVELSPMARGATSVGGELIKRGQGTSSLRIPRNATTGLSLPSDKVV
jgi:hypothetical protein